MKKQTIATVSFIGKSIANNRKKAESAAVDFQAYWAAYCRKDAKDDLEDTKKILSEAKEAGDLDLAEQAQKVRLQIEDALGRCKRLNLTTEEKAAIQSLKDRGFRFKDLCLGYITENLRGTEWVDGDGQVLKKASKSQIEAGKPEYIPVINWTPSTFANYLKKAYIEAHSEVKVSLR